MSDQLFTYVYDGGVMVAFGQNSRKIVRVRKVGKHIFISSFSLEIRSLNYSAPVRSSTHSVVQTNFKAFGSHLGP